jgi:tetratricopeptide (TPR) repeat protein
MKRRISGSFRVAIWQHYRKEQVLTTSLAFWHQSEEAASLKRMGRLPPTHIDAAAAVGRRIRQARDAAGLSLRALSFPGCTPSFLSRVESGERVPSQPVIDELARRLGVDSDQLTGVPAGRAIPAWRLSGMDLAARLADETALSQAEEVLVEARELGDQHAVGRALETLGHIALGERRDDAAASLFEQAREQDELINPRERPALFQALGRAYAGAGDLGHAIAVLQAAFDDARTEPPDVPLMVRFGSYLANAYTDNGHFGEAERVLGELLRYERQMTDRLSLVRMDFALARTYAEEGRTALAERYSRRLLGRLESTEEQETLGRAHLLLAEILLDRDDSATAERHLEEAQRLMGPTVAPPEQALITLERARRALQQASPDEAEQLARQAITETEATEPGIAGSAYTILAQIALDHGDLHEARMLCTSAIDLIQTTIATRHAKNTYDLLSRIEEAAGDLPAALAAARRAAELTTTAEIYDR